MPVMGDVLSFFAVYPDYIDSWLPILVSASITTIYITIGAFAVANLAGIVAASLRLSKNPIFSRISIVYIEIFRSVPTLVLLFMLYYGIVPLGIVIDPVPAAILALGLAGGAHMAEIFRSGIEAIHRGQREAAVAAGLTPFQSFRHVVFPQAIRVSLPPAINMLIVLLKDSSLASLISAPEIMLHARQIMARDFLPLHILLLAGAIYLVIGVFLSMLAMRVERFLSRNRKA